MLIRRRRLVLRYSNVPLMPDRIVIWGANQTPRGLIYSLQPAAIMLIADRCFRDGTES
jgi:hypothetical protein